MLLNHIFNIVHMFGLLLNLATSTLNLSSAKHWLGYSGLIYVCAWMLQ